MQEVQTTWRDLLGSIISNPKEKQRIAEELGVQAITLNRWISGESVPRSQNLRHLLNVLPKYREQLLDLIRTETGFEEFIEATTEDSTKEILSEFYTKIFATRASTTTSLRFWSICQLILQQAILQLDPDRLGMAIMVARCMPLSGFYRKVRSLRESIGTGIPPWGGNLEQKAMLLGAESLAGNVVTLCRPAIIQDLDEKHNLLPATYMEQEKSCAIYPILYAGRIAGVFMISSTQHYHFVSQARTALAQAYADLIALAFDPEDFYDPEDIALCILPHQSVQKPYFVSFRQRVADVIIEAAQKEQPINNIEAELQIWQNLEEELIGITAHKLES